MSTPKNLPALTAHLLRVRAETGEGMSASELRVLADVLDGDQPVFIEAGMRLRTESGRVLTVPRFKGTLAQRLRALDEWLVAEALDECEATESVFAAGMIGGFDPRRLSPSDRSSLNDVLFGSERGALRRHVVDSDTEVAA